MAGANQALALFASGPAGDTSAGRLALALAVVLSEPLQASERSFHTGRAGQAGQTENKGPGRVTQGDGRDRGGAHGAFYPSRCFDPI